MERTKVGIVGCGAISGIYIENLSGFEQIEVAACADIDLPKALAAADKYGIAQACSPEDLLSHPDIKVVVNLTVPKAHFPVALAALKKAKSVYNEKPLTVERKEAEELLALAKARNLRVACAPDTVLGAAIQTCRKIIDEGAIGEPLGGNAFMLCPGHESWHPSPEFYYEKGGGPLFDMGPYYLSAFITLLGPIESVVGSAGSAFATRTITSQALRGKQITVETPTHIVAFLEFAKGPLIQLTTSFDVQRTTLPPIEIYGTEATLLVPDPNGFGGEIQILRKTGEPEIVPHTHPFSGNARGIGVLDMVLAMQEGRQHRASGELGYHVLDVMHSVLESAEEGKRVEIKSRVDRPAAMKSTPVTQQQPQEVAAE